MILITGDKGFIGAHLSKKIGGVGFDLKDGLDIRNTYQLESIFQDNHIDTVIHLAALAGVRKSKLFPEDYISTNIQGIINLLECAKRHNVKHFISFSSSSVYGNQFPPNNEKDTLRPVSLYGITKLAGELLIQSSGIPYTIVRPFSVYGGNGRKDQVFYRWINQIKDNKPISFYGEGDSSRGYTHVSDIVQAVQRILEKGAENEVYNIGGNEIISLQELLSYFKGEFLTLEIEYLPLPQEDILENWADVAKAKEILGWAPKTVFRKELAKIFES